MNKVTHLCQVWRLSQRMAFLDCCYRRESYSWWTWENGAKTGAAVAFGVVAVAAAPVALSAVGFTSLGVAAGSIAASVQAPVTVAGSWFALAQSAGMAGLGLGAKAAIF